MEKRARMDLISELPQNIIETILSKLPITDVVKTSVLSTSWRYKWTSLPHLVFDDKNADTFIYKFLLLHNGPIVKFSISSSANCHELYQWLLFVSRKDVKELSVICGTLKAPSCIFSCKNLTHLKLGVRDMKIPQNFEGFPCLRSLHFEGVVHSDGLTDLVSKSLCLERLTLRIKNQGISLAISHPSLQFLNVNANLDVAMTNCPRLVEINAYFYRVDSRSELPSTKCFFHDFLGSSVNPQILNVSVDFMEYSTLGFGPCCCGLPVELVHLKSLKIAGIDHKLQHYVRVTELINICPNLTSLALDFWANEVDYDMHMEENALSLGTMAKLKSMVLKDICGVAYEMRLIELLLGSSPGLEKMHISLDEEYLTGKQRLEFDTQLLRFKRASSDASIVLKVKKI